MAYGRKVTNMQIRIVHTDKWTVAVQRKTRDGGKWNQRKVVREFNKVNAQWRKALAAWCLKSGHIVVSEIGATGGEA